MTGGNEFQVNSDWLNGIDSRPIFYDLVEDVMYGCIFYPALILVNSHFNAGASLYLKALILFLPMIAMTFNRKKAKRMYVFVLILLAMAALSLFLPLDLAFKIELFLAVLVSSVISAGKLSNSIKRLKCKNDPDIEIRRDILVSTPVIVCGVCFLYVTYMASLALNIPGMAAVCLPAAVILLLCYVVSSHDIGTFPLVKANRSHSSFVGKIKRFNLQFACWAAAFSAAIGFLTFITVYFTGLGGIDSFLINLFRVTPKEITTQPLPDAKKDNLFENLRLPGMEGQSLMATEILNRIFTVLCWIVIAGLVLIGLLLLFRLLFRFSKRLREHINEETRSVFSLRDIADDAAQKIKKSKIAVLFSGSSNSMKVRRIYYRIIKKYAAKGVRIANADSPTEIESKIAKTVKISENAGSDVTRIYHKARYGFHDCEKKDVENIRTEMKEWGKGER